MLATIVTFAFTFAGLSAAQSTVSLFIPGADPQPLVASIIGSDTLATTYAVECAPGTDGSDCGFAGIFILTEGPSTAAYTLSEAYTSDGSNIVAFTGFYDCSLDGTTAGVCTESFGGEAVGSDLGLDTETLSATDITYIPVTITAGALASNTAGSAVSSAASSSPAPATTKSAPTASNTSAGTVSSSGTGSAATQSQSTGTSASTSVSTSASAAGGQAMVTQKAGLVLGAAAAALAMMR